MTTAQYRELARQHEAQCKWQEAARCWGEAIRLYPRTTGALAKADIERMTARMESCAKMPVADAWTPESARMRVGGTFGT